MKKDFVPPSLEESIEYFESHEDWVSPRFHAINFWTYYESRDWKDIIKWRIAASGWYNRRKMYGGDPPSQAPGRGPRVSL